MTVNLIGLCDLPQKGFTESGQLTHLLPLTQHPLEKDMTQREEIDKWADSLGLEPKFATEPVGHIYTINKVQHCTIEKELDDCALYTGIQLRAAIAQAQAAEPAMPKIGCVQHDCDECQAREAAEPVGTVESAVQGTGGFHVRLGNAVMPSVGTKLYTSPQAQATEPVKLYFPTMLRKMWSGGEVQDWLNQLPPMYITPPDDLKFRPDWSGVEVLAEELREAHIEMEALRKANIDCVNHFDAIKDDYDKAQAAMKLALEALKLARGMHYTVSIPTEDAIAALEGSLK